MVKTIPAKKARGFTLVELIIVIVLLGIVGAVVFARFMSSSAFNPIGARNSIISVARTAQQYSLGRANVSFQIDQSGGEWLFSAIAGGTPLRTASVLTDNVVLETGSAAPSGNSCASAFDTAVVNDFALNFDARGNVADFTNNGATEITGAAFNGVRICVNDSVEFSVCISPAGHAYQGNCDD